MMRTCSNNFPIPVRAAIVVVSLLVLFNLACNKDDSGITSNEPTWTEPEHYSKETEPTLSLDREFIYFVVSDTLFPDKHGIYRARVDSPAREKVLAGFGFHSPVVSASGFEVAFLTGSTLNYLKLADGTVTSAGVSGNYEVILPLNDSLYVGCAGQQLYLINSRDSSVTRLGTGSDPTRYGPNRFIALTEVSAGAYAILKFTYRDDVEGDLFSIDTLDMLSASGEIRWLSLESIQKRYVYVEKLDTVNNVYTGQVGTTVKNFIATTDHVKAHILGYNLLIYPGPDGRFYQSNFEGSSKAPFWHAEETQ
ncbi:MAG: hypothetical protein JSU74_13340 [Candidatus Zixiibacteriota bacterium]|nr:MAG: hypothetical protein JSU74_13340 [candidate division Zixibacteria bacterium]